MSEQRITPRLDQLRAEWKAEQNARRFESEGSHRLAAERHQALGEYLKEKIDVLSAQLTDNTKMTQEILRQATATNGRITTLETIVGKDDSEGIRGTQAALVGDRTRALVLFSLLCTVATIAWLVWGDDIKHRGILNPPPDQVARQVEAVIEKRVQPSALKPHQP